jgi:hypothetical protein
VQPAGGHVPLPARHLQEHIRGGEIISVKGLSHKIWMSYFCCRNSAADRF